MWTSIAFALRAVVVSCGFERRSFLCLLLVHITNWNVSVSPNEPTAKSTIPCQAAVCILFWLQKYIKYQSQTCFEVNKKSFHLWCPCHSCVITPGSLRKGIIVTETRERLPHLVRNLYIKCQTHLTVEESMIPNNIFVFVRQWYATLWERGKKTHISSLRPTCQPQ